MKIGIDFKAPGRLISQDANLREIADEFWALKAKILTLKAHTWTLMARTRTSSALTT